LGDKPEKRKGKNSSHPKTVSRSEKGQPRVHLSKDKINLKKKCSLWGF